MNIYFQASDTSNSFYFIFLIKLLLSLLAKKNKKIDELEKKLKKKNVKNLTVHYINPPKSQPLHEKLLKSDAACRLWTGFPNLKSFEIIFNATCQMLHPPTRTTTTTKTTKKISSKVKRRSPIGRKKKISLKDECLLTLMKCRLGLINEDLAARFNISVSYVSKLFDKWISPLAVILKKTIFIPTTEQTKTTNPSRFQCFKNLKYHNFK